MNELATHSCLLRADSAARLSYSAAEGPSSAAVRGRARDYKPGTRQRRQLTRRGRLMLVMSLAAVPLTRSSESAAPSAPAD